MQLSSLNAEYPLIHLHFSWKQTDNGRKHCSVSSHGSFNCRFSRMKWGKGIMKRYVIHFKKYNTMINYKKKE